MEPGLSWIIFSYRILAETSTLRVRAWRILQRIGALSLQQSVCAVPNTSEATRKLKQLRDLIEEGGGETLWLEVNQFSEESMEQMVRLLNQERSDEYEMFIVACSKLSTILSSAEYESELKRLQKWFRKMQARDYFNCPAAQAASKKLADVEKQFADWMEKVK